MKLSEAIRLGAALAPQAFAILATKDKSGRVLSTCAIGAALHAVSAIHSDTTPSTSELTELFSVVTALRSCPGDDGCVYWVASVFEVVTHLNDNHLWSRERIADWVETVEAEEDAAHATETETCAAAV